MKYDYAAHRLTDWWSHPEAQRAVDFFQSLTLFHNHSGKRWVLEEWQESLVRECFGKRTPDGRRLVDTLSYWAGRGNGKTPIATGFALEDILCGPDGREAYIIGPDEKRARIAYDYAAQIVRSDRHLRSIAKCKDSEMVIEIPKQYSRFQALSSISSQGHGYVPSLLIVEEVHLMESRQVYDNMLGGLHKRPPGEVMEIQISTAGDTRSGLAWELYSLAKKVDGGRLDMPNMVTRIFECDPEDEPRWRDPEIWKKANPASWLNHAKLHDMVKKAEHTKHLEHSFKQVHLGLWLETHEDTWIDLEEWRACADAYTEDDLLEEPCILALDMSSVNDLTSIVLYFHGSKRILTWSFLPGEGIAKRAEKDKVDYQTWANQGRLILTSGKKINHEEVAVKINELLGRFQVEQFVADPALLSLIAPHLDSQPETYKQTYEYLNPPCQQLELLISNKQIKHDDNPLLNWCFGNVVVIKDKQDRLFPAKKRSRGRIDPVVALLMAIGVSMGDEPEVDINKLWANTENYQISLEPVSNQHQ